jgi:hypothetical protein
MIVAAADVESAIAAGRDLQAWWTNVEDGTNAVERFDLLPAFPGGGAVRGFFGDVRAGGTTDPYMGYSADYFFDLGGGTEVSGPRAAAWLTDQVEEFALRYWLRADAFALPQPYGQVDPPAPPPWLAFLDLNPSSQHDLVGMTNVMRTYKRLADGATGQFPDAVARAIVDLRELETAYEWITIERLAQGLSVALALPGAAPALSALTGPGSSLSLSMPLATSLVLAMHADLTVRVRNPTAGVLGEFGAALCAVPPSDTVAGEADQIGSLQTGLRLQTLRVLETGEIWLKTVTIMRRCTDALGRFSEMSALSSTARALVMMSSPANPAATPVQVEKHVLCAHAIHLRDTLLGTRGVWQQVPDWLSPSSIPDWVVAGKDA